VKLYTRFPLAQDWAKYGPRLCQVYVTSTEITELECSVPLQQKTTIGNDLDRVPSSKLASVVSILMVSFQLIFDFQVVVSAPKFFMQSLSPHSKYMTAYCALASYISLP
jgi:hypothetical protein